MTTEIETHLKRASRVKITGPDSTKEFTAEEFHRAMRSANLVGAFAFWLGLQGLAQPDEWMCMHARGVLRALAAQQFNHYDGVAVSPQHAEAFRHCGLIRFEMRHPEISRGSRTGLGLITKGNFFAPQVNLPGSMASFVLPAAIPVPAPMAANSGKSGWACFRGVEVSHKPIVPIVCHRFAPKPEPLVDPRMLASAIAGLFAELPFLSPQEQYARARRVFVTFDVNEDSGWKQLLSEEISWQTNTRKTQHDRHHGLEGFSRNVCQVCNGSVRLRAMYFPTLVSPDVDAQLKQLTVDTCAPRADSRGSVIGGALNPPANLHYFIFRDCN